MMEELLRRMAAEAAEEERKKPKPLPEAVVMELREAARRYERVNPFKVGDVVTPAPNSYLKSRGEPHVVVGLRTPAYQFDGQPGHVAYGARVDMRVMEIKDGSMYPFWVESPQFDPWVDGSAMGNSKPEPVSSEHESFLMHGEGANG